MRKPVSAIALMLLLTVLACRAAGQDDAEVLRTIIEKARQREAALERADLKYSGTAASVQAVMPVGVAFEGRYLKSQDMYRHDVQARMKAPGMEQSMKVASVSDGDTSRTAGEQSDGNSFGMIQKRTEGFRDRMPTPEDLAITRLFMTPGTLSEYLEADTAKYSERYGDRFTAAGALMETTLRAREKVGERECIVVECFASPGEGREEIVNRLYFAEDLNYACVKFEGGKPTPDGFTPAYSVSLDDFREVMEGVFIPFVVSATGFNPNGQPQATVQCKVESLEFPEYFDPEVFTLVFPDGTRVFDELAGVDYVVGGGDSQGATTEDMLLEMAAEVIEVDETAPEPAPVPVVEAAEPVPPPVEAPPVEPEQVPSGPPIAILALVAALILGAATAALLAVRRRKTKRD